MAITTSGGHEVDTEAVLHEAERLVQAGDHLAAIELLHAANARMPHERLECELAIVRNRAYGAVTPSSRHTEWPVPVPADQLDQGPPRIPDLAPGELTGAEVRRLIAASTAALPVRSAMLRATRNTR